MKQGKGIYLRNTEALSGNFGHNYKSLAVKNFDANSKEDYLKFKYGDNKYNDNLIQNIGTNNNINYNEPWGINNDVKLGLGTFSDKENLNLRKNRVRYEFNRNSKWDYHHLFKRKYSENVNTLNLNRAKKPIYYEALYSIINEKNESEGKTLRPELLSVKLDKNRYDESIRKGNEIIKPKLFLNK
tara:strand:+ start:8277 stop:8831 length:555 start_codon:yes stop_codon:yes gene_type:complete